MSLPIFLQDKRFLHELDKLRIKEQFVKITVLNWVEEPLLEVQGRVISGSVTLDGSSSMRRTATLSIFAEEKDNNLANIDHLFAINKKCKLELGIINTVSNYVYELIDKDERRTIHTIDYKKLYGDIVWFPLGVYVMFNPSVAHSISGVTISMNLKDKMCLLNGDVGGQIHSSVDFAYKDLAVRQTDGASILKKPVLIYDIILELVNHWGNEQLNKIIISDIPERIKRVVKWMGNTPAYLVQTIDLAWLFDDLTEANAKINEKKLIKEKVMSIHDYGYDVGFFYDPFEWPEAELVSNIGDTVTSVLDKIIEKLGNHEYFYDVEGNFVFQEKKNYLNITNTAYWNAHESEEGVTPGVLPADIVYKADTYRFSRPVYSFVYNEFTSAYNNTINYNNIKNDFVVWGAFKNTNSNIKNACRFHLAIDKIPEIQTHNNIVLYDDDFGVTRAFMLNNKDFTGIKQGQTIVYKDTELLVKEAISSREAQDWRLEIYYQMLEDEISGTGVDTELNNTYFQYYAELKEEFPKIFDLNTQEYKIDFIKHPNEITYFLDFIDESSELGKYSVNNIGRRSKILDGNQENLNCVFEPYIPEVAYFLPGNPADNKVKALLSANGYKWSNIDAGIAKYLATGGVFKSCFEKIKDLLYQYTHINNTISITTLPIYHLEPNTRITVEDGPAGIYGDYIIQSISVPLDISSTMTINAYKALQKI